MLLYFYKNILFNTKFIFTVFIIIKVKFPTSITTQALLKIKILEKNY